MRLLIAFGEWLDAQVDKLVAAFWFTIALALWLAFAVFCLALCWKVVGWVFS